jgi:hypothetical protein
LKHITKTSVILKTRILILAVLFSVNSVNAQIDFAPHMVNTAGGSGTIGTTYFDFTIGESSIVFGGTGCDSVYSAFQHLAVDVWRTKRPLLTVSGSTILCTNTVVTLIAPTSYSVLWSNGSTGQTLSVTANGTFNATLTNSCGQKQLTDTISVKAYPVPTPSICLVTVDSLGINNEIYWDKTQFLGADTFIVYREITGSVYAEIGRMSINGAGSLVDTVRVPVPGCTVCTTGDPNATSHRYKIRIQDTCGKLSAYSPYHESIHVQDAKTGQFNWNYYFIEGIGNLPTATYLLWRQSVFASAPSTVVGSATTNSYNDVQYSNLAVNGDVRWYVSTIGFPCTASLGTKGQNPAGTKPTRTKSNNTNERNPVGIKTQILPYFKLFPNPAADKITVACSEKLTYVFRLSDISGRIVHEQECKVEYSEIDLTHFSNGVYFVNIMVAGKNQNVYKVVIQR